MPTRIPTAVTRIVTFAVATGALAIAGTLYGADKDQHLVPFHFDFKVNPAATKVAPPKTVVPVVPAVPATTNAIVVPTAEFPRARATEMGINLEGLSDFARSMMFVDTIKAARKFGSAAAPWDEAAPTDANGWPTGDAGLIVMADVPVPPGNYLFSCLGKCDVGLSATSGAIKAQTYSAKTNTTTAIVVINAGSTNLFLSLNNTNGGVKNVRLMRPGYALTTDQVFSNEFLKAIAPFSTLRLMDITHTNGSAVVEWKDRTQPGTFRQAGDAGMAWEYAIQLANTANKDLWINIPANASDDYVKQLALLFKQKLDSHRSIYVEYSNEVWNGTFPQSGQNLNAALAEVAAGNTALTDRGTDDNQYYWAWKRVAERLLQISAIFKNAYGTDVINTRVRPVLAAQAANAMMVRMQLDFIERNYGQPSKFIYGVAGAPYISPADAIANQPGATVTDLLQSIAANTWSGDSMKQYNLAARDYRLHSLCYEGGIGVDGATNQDAKVALNRAAGIATVINNYFNSWYAGGGELFMYYNLASPWNQYGCWGLTDDVRVATPKSQAVNSFATASIPAATGGVAIPGIVQAWQYDANNGGGVEVSDDGGKDLAFLRDGQWFNYLVNVQTAGIYQLTIQAASGDDAPRIHAYLSDTDLGTIGIPATGGGQTWGSTAPVALSLQPGRLVLRLVVERAGLNVRSITLSRAAVSSTASAAKH